MHVYMDSDELKKAIAARIAYILREKGWSNNQLGREAGLQKSYISSVMTGSANLTLESIAKLENALKTPIIQIFKAK